MKHFLLTCCLLATASLVSAQDFETATETIQQMGVGWNLGNTLDANSGQRMADIVASETYWGQPVTKPELMTMMRDAGFGAIRVPVTWFPHMNDAGVVDEEWMNRVHEVVDYVLDAGLYCILNVHHDTGADADGYTSWLKADETYYQNNKVRYENLWRQIASEFRDYDDHLLFESYNEMLDVKNSWCFASFNATGNYDAAIAASAYNAINSYAQSFVDVVRATGGNNQQRNLVVNTYGACSGAGTWNSHLKDPLIQMALPDDPAGTGHLLFQVHSYPDISNLATAKSEIDGMISALNTHLVSKGAPVIIGEWGTSDTNADYMNRPEQLFQFVDYAVDKAKQNHMATFFWMGLSDGSYRSLPAFSQPDLAERIVKAWHGSDYQGVFPTMDDFDVVYLVNYTATWQELNLYGSTLSLTDYKGIRVVMAEQPAANALQVKCYGENNKNQYQMLSATGLETTVMFNASAVGQKMQRITLQTMIGAQEVKLKTAYLIRQDGTEQQLHAFSPFWGCVVEMVAQPTDIDSPLLGSSQVQRTTDGYVYNLQGQRVQKPTMPGVYVRNGRKVVVKRK